MPRPHDSFPREPAADTLQEPAAAYASASANAHPLRWSATDYLRLAEQGLISEQGVELIYGEILVMSPQGYRHVVACDLLQRALTDAFGSTAFCRGQSTFHTSPRRDSLPEPDLAIFPGAPQDHLRHPPDRSLLVVEVSQTSIRYDRDTKRRLYAEFGVPEYWVLDLNVDRLLVYREPFEHPIDGWTYRNVTTFDSGDQIAPLHAPDVGLDVADMFPPVTDN